ncbi:hypothetical protein [Edwardsiella piscicida]|uniref:hypothetical protein n=1 Tax=Edwardsiella piscicida TaxID=1263550 RepID=UPI00370D0E82
MADWRIGGLADWRIGGLADWRIGGLADWRIGGLAQFIVSGKPCKPFTQAIDVIKAPIFKRLSPATSQHCFLAPDVYTPCQIDDDLSFYTALILILDQPDSGDRSPNVKRSKIHKHQTNLRCNFNNTFSFSSVFLFFISPTSP